jgi:hypothetical protein
MDEQTRKAWSRPELIVIVRGGPQEAVLAGCKAHGASGPGPGTAYDYCTTNVCGTGQCSGWVTS